VKIKTVNKISRNKVDVTTPIEVITHQEIINFGANSLLEVLDRATSIGMSGTFFWPQNAASMRGGISTGADHHVLLLFNGRPMRDSFTGGENFAFYTSFPIRLIKQIEIIRGPGSVLYGSNAFTGVINIITYPPGETPDNISLTAGSFNTKKVQVTTSYQNEKVKFSTGLHWLREDGWNYEAKDNNGLLGSFDAGENNFGLVFTGDFNKLQVNGLYIKSEQDFWGSTSSWSTLSQWPTSELNIQSKRFMLDLGYQFVLNQDRYIDANISYNTQRFTHVNYDSESRNSFAELTHHWKISDTLHWLVGGTAWYQDVTSYPGAKVAPVHAFSQTWYNIYTQAEINQTDNLKWTIGAQVNKIPEVDANTAPRIGFNYQLTKQSGFKFNYGQAFRAAYGVETHFDMVICCRDDGTNKGGLRGNHNLKPETITTTDLQYYHYSNNHQLNLTFFKSKQEDLIERERAADRVLDFINRGKLNIEGAEIEYKYTFNPSSQLVSSFSHQVNKTGSDTKNTTLNPNNILKIGFTHKFRNEVKLAIHNSYFGKSYDNIIRYPSRQNFNPEADSYNMMSANIHIPLNKFLDTSASDNFIELYIYNLLDEDIFQPEVAGGQINTNPLRAERGWYLSFTKVF